jgi:hypothetical protein
LAVSLAGRDDAGEDVSVADTTTMVSPVGEQVERHKANVNGLDDTNKMNPTTVAVGLEGGTNLQLGLNKLSNTLQGRSVWRIRGELVLEWTSRRQY